MNALALVATFAGLFFQAAAPAPLIDNERVTVWETNGGPAQRHSLVDEVEIVIARDQGTAFFLPKGKGGFPTASFRPEKTIEIALKDHTVAPLANKSGYPNAFPRPGVKKLIDNARVIVWEYTWKPGEPTPMHFHDKDVVVVYTDDGDLQSTTPDGKKVVNKYTFGMAKFNARDRMHTELLVNGHEHAVMMELK